jgi:hypothetical protein
MSAILRSVWIDVAFVLVTVGVLFAGMRGFSNFFPVVLGLADLYLFLMALRFLRRKKN